MSDQKLSELLDIGDIGALNRLVATGSIDKNEIISKHIDVPPSLYLSGSKIHGTGVFSHTKIKVGQIIESVNTIQLEFPAKYHKDRTILDYCYAFPDDSPESKQHGSKLYIFTGYGMMYNHKSPNNNARWLWDIPNNQAKLVAISTIEKDYEITINYGAGYWNRGSGL